MNKEINEAMIRQSQRRTILQKYITDPLTGVLILAGWGFFRVMPVDMASFVGAGLGKCLSHVMIGKNKVAMFNLKRCFPQMSVRERRAVLSKMWTHFGRILGEFPHLSKMSDRIEFVNKEFFTQAKNDKKAGLFFSAHMGNWEMFSIIVQSIGMPLHPVYRAANNPWAEKLIYQHRRTAGVHLIPKGTVGARQMIELLDAGEHIAIMCDQKLREGIDVPFFGYPTPTAPAVASMALKWNVPIYPVLCTRTKGAHYRVEAFPPLMLLRSGDRQEEVLFVMKTINEKMEGWIKKHPEQWLWIHHRWPKEEYKKRHKKKD